MSVKNHASSASRELAWKGSARGDRFPPRIIHLVLRFNKTGDWGQPDKSGTRQNIAVNIMSIALALP